MQSQTPVRLTSRTRLHSFLGELVGPGADEGRGPRAVDRAVESAEARDRRVDHRVDLVRPRHVGPDEDGLAAPVADRARGFLAALRDEVGDHHAGAAFGEEEGGFATDAGAASGHESGTAVEAGGIGGHGVILASGCLVSWRPARVVTNGTGGGTARRQAPCTGG